MTIPLLSLSILGFIGFAFLHSILARRKVKGFILKKFPRLSAFYRIIYVIIAVATLALWWWYIPEMPAKLYIVPTPVCWLFRLIQLCALYGFYTALRNSNTGTFLGIRQIKKYMTDGTLPDDYDEYSNESLHSAGLYRYMRHPLYTFSILFMMANPVMSIKWAYMVLLFTLYFWIGSYFEERGLIRKFGESYKQYQKKVPRFIPRLSSLRSMMKR